MKIGHDLYRCEGIPAHTYARARAGPGKRFGNERSAGSVKQRDQRSLGSMPSLSTTSSAWGRSSRVREHDHPDHALGQIHERGIYTEVRTLGSNSEGKQEQKVQLRLQTNKSDTAMR
jgi:hypothetical protein